MSEPNMSKTFFSWAFVLLVTGALAWHYAGRPNLFSRFANPIHDTPGDNTAASKSRRKTRPKKDGSSDEKNRLVAPVGNDAGPSAVDASSSKKRKIARTLAGSASVVASPVTSTKDEDDGVNNAAFAEQFVKARAGTPLNKPSSDRPSKKDRRAQKARTESASASPIVSTEPSSTTGADDADDDMSPIASPAFDASGLETVKSGDVADMLEPARGGPGVIRLTGDLDSPQKKIVPKQYQVAESKKKRQARLKREQQKQEIAAAEAERKRLEEHQLRSARIAAGTSNQVKADAFKPVANVWTQNSQAKAPSTIPDRNEAEPLLDTFETTVQPDPASNGTDNSADVKKAELSGASNKQQNLHAMSQPNNKGVSRGVFQENGLHEIQNVPPTPSERAHAETTSGSVNKESKTDQLHATTTSQAPHEAKFSQKPKESSLKKENIAPGPSILPQSGSEPEEKISWADDLPSEEEQLRRLHANEDEWNTVSNKRDKKRTVKTQAESITGGKGNASDGASSITIPKQPAPARQSAATNSNGFASLALPSENQVGDSDWEA